MPGPYLMSGPEYSNLLEAIEAYKKQIVRLKTQRDVAVALAADREELLEKLLKVTQAEEEDR